MSGTLKDTFRRLGSIVFEAIQGMSGLMGGTLLIAFFIPATALNIWLSMLLVLLSLMLGAMAIVALIRDKHDSQKRWKGKIDKFYSENLYPMLAELYSSFLKPFLFIGGAVCGGAYTLVLLLGIPTTSFVLTTITMVSVTLAVAGVCLSYAEETLHILHQRSSILYWVYCLIKLVEGGGEILSLTGLLFLFFPQTALLHAAVIVPIVAASCILGLFSLWSTLQGNNFNEKAAAFKEQVKQRYQQKGANNTNESSAWESWLDLYLRRVFYERYVRPFLVNFSAFSGFILTVVFFSGAPIMLASMVPVLLSSVVVGMVGVFVYNECRDFENIDIKYDLIKEMSSESLLTDHNPDENKIELIKMKEMTRTKHFVDNESQTDTDSSSLEHPL